MKKLLLLRRDSLVSGSVLCGHFLLMYNCISSSGICDVTLDVTPCINVRGSCILLNKDLKRSVWFLQEEIKTIKTQRETGVQPDDP